MNKHRAALLALEPQLTSAIARQQTHNLTAGPQLASLDEQKQADNARTQQILAHNPMVRAITVSCGNPQFRCGLPAAAPHRLRRRPRRS